MPILDANTFEFFSRSPDQTRRIGIRLGSLLEAGDVVCLCGDLGAGKTTLTQGIARGWGALEQATSPTFVLVKNYSRPDGASIFHLDAYRLEDALEAEDLDMDSFMESGPFIIEWPERILAALPEEHLWIDLTYQGDEQRGMVFKPAGKRFITMVDTLKNEMIKGYQ
jgi:tRNA threonylcarbamoyladenosine biosynthesis protein TsaE